jgi:ACT domain
LSAGRGAPRGPGGHRGTHFHERLDPEWRQHVLRHAAPVPRERELADITRELAEQGISIASVIQREALEEHEGDTVPLVLMTHTALTGSFRAALAAIDRLGCVAAPGVSFPVAD